MHNLDTGSATPQKTGLFSNSKVSSPVPCGRLWRSVGINPDDLLTNYLISPASVADAWPRIL